MDRGNKTGYVRASKKPKSSGGHNYQSKKMVGNVTEGQGYADKRKRKILSTYKKLVRKSRKAEINLSSGGKQLQGGKQYGSLAMDSADAGVKIEHSKNIKMQHYTNNRQGHKQTFGYNKDKHTQHARGATKWNGRGNVTRYTEAERQRQKQIQEHQQKLKEKNTRWKAREEALRNYREKKETRHKKLSKRTPRGQPIIKYEMDYLLQKIQSQIT